MTTAQPTTQTPPEPRRLERSRRRMIAGVGGGLGRYFGIDPVIFRIGLVALTLFGGTGLFVYAAVVLFVPMEGSTTPPLGVRFFRGDREVWKPVVLAAAVLAVSGLAAVASAWATGTGSGGVVAGVVIFLGLALAVSAFRGGARWLILPALAVALPAGVVSAAGVDLHGGVGERNFRPHSLAEVRQGYRLGVGQLNIDLRDVSFPAGERTLDLKLGTGQIDLIVPENVCVVTRARVGAGYVGALDREGGGLDVNWSDTPPSHPGVPRLVVDSDIGIGAIMVAHRAIDGEYRVGRYGTNDVCRSLPAR
jgi:phage shock protein PspC (stress-responsive transcriptional regulator)